MAISMESWVNNQQAYINSGVREMAQVRDFSAAQRQTQSIVQSFEKNNEAVRSLQAESNSFLNTYSAGMNNQNQAASRLTGEGVDAMLQADEDGNVSRENVQKTVTAVRDMVTQYNDNLRLLNDNAERGPGVNAQMARMVQDPAPAESLAQAGVTVNDDGTLSLNEEALAEGLSSAETREATAAGVRSLAEGVQEDAEAALETSSSELVRNDVSRAQTIREEDPLRQMARDIRGMGGAALNNYFFAMSGSMMNMVV